MGPVMTGDEERTARPAANHRGVSVRVAMTFIPYAIAGRLIAASREDCNAPLATTLREVSKSVTGKEIVYSETELARTLSPRHFVEVRKTHGGPAPSETSRASAASRKALASDEQWLRDTLVRLQSAEQKLKFACANL